jgi:hypothetical protein
MNRPGNLGSPPGKLGRFKLQSSAAPVAVFPQSPAGASVSLPAVSVTPMSSWLSHKAIYENLVRRSL